MNKESAQIRYIGNDTALLTKDDRFFKYVKKRDTSIDKAEVLFILKELQRSCQRSIDRIQEFVNEIENGGSVNE